jgi:hypothetical protein
MKKIALILAAATLATQLVPRISVAQDSARWQKEAQRVTIIRDD